MFGTKIFIFTQPSSEYTTMNLSVTQYYRTSYLNIYVSNNPGPNCPGPNCPHLKNGQLGPGQLSPGPNCPGPNCPPLKNGQLGPGQLGPRQVYYPWTQKLPQVFGTNIRIKSRMLNCTNILDNVPSPPQGPTGPNTTIKLDNSPKCSAKKSGQNPPVTSARRGAFYSPLAVSIVGENPHLFHQLHIWKIFELLWYLQTTWWGDNHPVTKACGRENKEEKQI